MPAALRGVAPPVIHATAPAKMAKYEGALPLVYNLEANREQIADMMNHSTESLEGTASILAGTGIPGVDPVHQPTVRARSAQLNQPLEIVIGTSGPYNGFVFFTCATHAILQIDPDGALSYVCGDVKHTSGRSGYEDGDMTAARFSSPSGLALNEAECILYVADTRNACIRAVHLPNPPLSGAIGGGDGGGGGRARGHVTTLVGRPSPRHNDHAMLRAYQPKRNPQYELGRVHMSHVGAMSEPVVLAFDPLTNILYVGDDAGSIKAVLLSANLVITICPEKPPKNLGVALHGADIYSSQIRAYQPRGLVIDYTNDRLLVADAAYHMIHSFPRVPSDKPRTTTTVVAGRPDQRGQIEGKAIGEAQFDQPWGLAIDPNDGTLFIADSANHVIRGLTSRSAEVYSMVGSGSYGCLQGTGPLAEFYQPRAVALHPGTYQMVVTETNSNLIRLVDVSVPKKSFLKIVNQYSGVASLGTLPFDVVGIIVQYTHRVHTSNLPDEYRFKLGT